MAGDHGLDWGGVHHDKRWTILRTQKRFFLWALYTSIGSMMLGKCGWICVCMWGKPTAHLVGPPWASI